MHLKNYAVAVTAIVKVVIQGEGACLFLLYELWLFLDLQALQTPQRLHFVYSCDQLNMVKFRH